MSREWDFDLEAVHGPQGFTEEDANYKGSLYSEVKEALYKNPYREGSSGEKPGPLPMFRSPIKNAYSGALGIGEDHLKKASARAIDSRADLRWGPDGKGFRRVLSPNGICLLGKWSITEENPYSGYFKKGSEGLFVGRYSTDGNETWRGVRRSLSLAGKLYPTTNKEHAEPLIPASFMSQEDLGGMNTPYINDAELRNEPNVTAIRRGIYTTIILRAGLLFTILDKVPDSRQLYEISELGLSEDEPVKTPRHMMLRVKPDSIRIEGDKLDFRDEVYGHIFRDGSSEPNGTLEFDIYVADKTRSKGFPGLRRIIVEDWQRVGEIVFNEAVASYNGDHVVTFHHPGWRKDRNDPSTAIRSGSGRCPMGY